MEKEKTKEVKQESKPVVRIGAKYFIKGDYKKAFNSKEEAVKWTRI